MAPLVGKSALITGASRRQGIGYAIAHRLAQDGADLLLHTFTPYDRQLYPDDPPEAPGALADALRQHGTRILTQEADLADPDAPVHLIDAAWAAFGHLDILILNHAYDTLLELDDLTADAIDRHLHVNVRAALLMVQAFARHHDGRPGGRVILMTSGQHLGPMPHLAYVATKGALHQLTASLSNVLIEQGITVNTINPGPTRTSVPSPDLDAAVLADMPLGRWGRPDDAARLIAWLVSDEAAWVTGQVINSEGGFRR